MGYVPAIDGLRAVAVLAVLLYHVDAQWLPGGFAGVDVFFVISGFVVTATATFDDIRARDLIAGFYARRIVRIAPALLILLLGTWLLAMLFVPQYGFSRAGAGTGLAAFFGVSNISLAYSTEGYFAVISAMDPFLHTWSLGVEEQFYLVFPLVLWAAGRDRREGRVPWRALGAVVIASILSLLFYSALSVTNPTLAFYLMPARFWELGAGVALALAVPLWLRRLRRLNSGAALLAWAVCFLAISWFFVRLPGSHLGLPPLVLPVGGTIGLIALACARPALWPARALSLRPIVQIGLASYSLYLWHWPLLALMRWTFGLDTPVKLGATLFAIAVAAYLSWRYVERPTREAFRRGALSRRQVLAVGPAAIAAGAAAAWLLLQVQPRIALGTAFDATARLPEDACVVPVRTVAMEGGEKSGWRPCVPRPNALFIIGDSHAAAYDQMGGLYAARTGGAVRIDFRSGCEFPPLVVTAPWCQRWYDAVIRSVAHSAKSGDVILLTSFRIEPPGAPLRSAGERLRRRQQAAIFLRPLASTGATIVLEAPKPAFSSPPYRCVDWFNRVNPACRAGFTTPRGPLLERRAAVLEDLQLLAATTPGAVIWDPFPILCPADPCRARQRGKWIYRDDNHVMPAASHLLLPNFMAAAGQTPIGRR